MRIFRGRKAVITGAASGIGRAIALALAAEGVGLFLIDRDEERLANVVSEATGHGVEVAAAVCDLAIPAEITEAITRVRAMWDGEIHILANCAGIASYGPFHLAADEAWRRLIAVNLLAPMQIIHELLSTLIGAEQAHILNICSMAGLIPLRKLPAYQASKYGLVGFTLALRNDYHRDNFGITALCPGFVRTPLLTNLKDPEPHRRAPVLPDFISTTPDVVAAAALAAIRNDRGLVVVTPLAKLAWWLTRLCPTLFAWINREGWRRRGQIDLPARESQKG
jgi:3-oxoacyl-[acyl-carrier protein] reductase